MNVPLFKYFVIKDVGVRIWFYPSWWRLGYHKVGGRTIYELGPVSIYTGW